MFKAIILPAYRRHFLQRSEIERLLVISCGFSVLLTAARILYSGSLMFAWLNWNLFLAYVPYLISGYIISNPRNIENNKRFVFLFLAWLLFIPNSFYIITDLFHLQEREPLPLWYDLALLVSFVWNGIMLGVLSVRQMEKIICAKFQVKNESLFVFAIMWLNAFGVYVGRYLRYNSWDVITNPFALFQDIIYMMMHPIRNRFDWAMIICYAMLMTMIYAGFKLIAKMRW